MSEEIKGESRFEESEKFSFNKPGDSITGTLVEKATITIQDKKGAKEVKKYVLLTAANKRMGFLGNYDLNSKLPKVPEGTNLTVTLERLAENPHGGLPMRIFKVVNNGSKSAAEIVKNSRA